MGEIRSRGRGNVEYRRSRSIAVFVCLLLVDYLLERQADLDLTHSFETEMSPLYPLLSPLTFSPSHLPHLTSTESLLLASMITISARYSALPSPARARAIHKSVADYIRDELIGLLDGSGELRHISSVEALLLLTEWPPVADRRKGKNKRRGDRYGGEAEEEAPNGSADEAAELLRTSTQYDGMSWSFIGMLSTRI